MKAAAVVSFCRAWYAKVRFASPASCIAQAVSWRRCFGPTERGTLCLESTRKVVLLEGCGPLRSDARPTGCPPAATTAGEACEGMLTVEGGLQSLAGLLQVGVRRGGLWEEVGGRGSLSV